MHELGVDCLEDFKGVLFAAANSFSSWSSSSSFRPTILAFGRREAKVERIDGGGVDNKRRVESARGNFCCQAHNPVHNFINNSFPAPQLQPQLRATSTSVVNQDASSTTRTQEGIQSTVG
jgi:hypothetical protein